MTLITREVLLGWTACEPGLKRFCELFPEGATLKVAIDGLVADGHDDWGLWLFAHCKKDDRFKDQTVEGYRNTGNRNTGNRNTGNRNTGDWNTGDGNTGNWNSGNWNSGDRNSGYQNSGNQNSGNWNSGNWNSGNWNTGYFNTKTPATILAFDKECQRTMWDSAPKPQFISRVKLAVWISESEMTDEQKAADPHFYVCGGQLNTVNYKDAWKSAWDEREPNDEALLRALPNFDAAVFLEITGIDVDAKIGALK